LANLKFTGEILDDILFRAGEPSDGTSDFHAQALIALNRAYRAIWMGGGEFVKDMNEPWLWLKKDPPGVITLNPVVDTGTVAVTNNSTAITFSSAPAASMAGRFFRTDDIGDTFRIASHTGGNAAATLDSPYTGLTNAAVGFRAMQLEYNLPADCLRVIAPMRVQRDDIEEIEGVDLVSLDRDYPIAYVEAGVPHVFALVTETKVRFNRYGMEEATDFVRVELDYLQKPADLTDSASEEPLVPLQYRQVLSDIGLFYVLSDKSDSRVELIGLQARAGLQAMASDNRARLSQVGRNQGRIYPRGRHYRGSRVRVLYVG
jgi:hypothetical protein